MSIATKKVQKKSKSDHSIFRKKENSQKSPAKQNTPVDDILQLQQTIGNQAVQRLFKSGALQQKENHTGLPNNLKGGIENLSGHSMDDVKVHYNSSQPVQLNAHAFAKGSDIHLASGAEKHLSHEAWHVVQQKQGRVQPTKQLKGKVNINDDEGLEREADVMGGRALQMKKNISSNLKHSVNFNYKIRQFKVSKQYPKIKNKLSYKLLDWAITENDTNTVKNILDNLSGEDWADTKAKMIKDKIWSRFVNNLSGKNKLNLKKWKKVSAKAMQRIGRAKKAIKHTKNVFKYGAGNQKNALIASNFNSTFRLLALRDQYKKYWKLTKLVRPIAKANPTALIAAKADMMHGGNCGEHASVAFDYLRYKYPGEMINHSKIKGFDHAFVLIGKKADKADKDNDIVVADAWPTQATATIWSDHFAYKKDRNKIKVAKSMIADGQNIKEVIAHGLSLTKEGIKESKKTLSSAEVKKEIIIDQKSKKKWIWNNTDTASKGKKYNYYSSDPKLSEPKSPKKETKKEIEKTVFFLFDSAKVTLKSEANKKMGKLVIFLFNNPSLVVEIRGYSDSYGKAKFNLELSQKRADRVRKALVDAGIDGGRLTAKGYGERNPIANNSSAKGRKANRRVELRIS